MFVFTHNTQRCRRAYPGLFSPTLHTLIGLQVHCTGFQPFAPWRTAGPSFAASRHGSGLLLRSATSRVSFSCGNLGLRSPTSASFCSGRRTQLVPRLRARENEGLSVCCMEPISSSRARGSVPTFHCGIQSRPVRASFQAIALVPVRVSLNSIRMQHARVIEKLSVCCQCVVWSPVRR